MVRGTNINRYKNPRPVCRKQGFVLGFVLGFFAAYENTALYGGIVLLIEPLNHLWN